MIQASELRIGNIIRCNKKFSKGNHVVSTNTFAQVEDSFRNNLGLYEPIELSEEILLKCGFEKEKDCDFGYSIRINNDWSKIYYDYENKYCELSVNNHSCPIDMQYLHQLQNLYFALTQTELEINL